MVGELILGRFRIEQRIGSGGFGTVYRAWDERLERPVAVKVIESEANAPRVSREAQAVARLDHRNLATLYELDSEEGRAYLVSELIDGPTVRALGRRGELTDALLASIGADCASALSHAHRNGVVHRDVKPENVLVAPGGEAKLVDFGIARIAGERTLTRTGDVLGTLGYMAPEQADGQRPGPAADVYSLALTLYEGFSGEHPRIGEGGPAATARAIDEPVPPLTEVRPDLPASMTDAIDAALDPDPELRPLASELEGALAAHEGDLDGSRLPPVLRPDEPDEPRIRHRRNLVPVAAMAAKIGALALVAWLLLGARAPGAALVAGLLCAPLMLLPLRTPALTRALLGGMAYLWLAAIEIGTGRTLLFGPETAAPDGWEQSLSAGFTDVVIPLFDPLVLAGAGLWALAAVTLPLLVRGRVPVLDAVGALIWAAALITALRLLAGPQGEPGGLVVAALAAGAAAVVVGRRARVAAPRPVTAERGVSDTMIKPSL
jgi:eukaryotic-like serine/threonine-protein kinase